MRSIVRGQNERVINLVCSILITQSIDVTDFQNAQSIIRARQRDFFSTHFPNIEVAAEGFEVCAPRSEKFNRTGSAGVIVREI